ncbi:hypothetical protein M569_09186 [Genlisea aurea]|uniref:Uncharacterized protein n=1 Tax=Genlisea aurea TaxID=192259 RepID=S8CLE3_9LAMI|nr:hypothetical protein M569_09186 [Genlisea aurea]
MNYNFPHLTYSYSIILCDLELHLQASIAFHLRYTGPPPLYDELGIRSPEMASFRFFVDGWRKHGTAVMALSVLFSVLVLLTYHSTIQRSLWGNVETHLHAHKGQITLV